MPSRKTAEPADKAQAPKKRVRPPKAKAGPKPTKPEPGKNGPGRPLVYDQPYHDDHVFRLALFGHTNDEIAKFFGLGLTTLDTWIATYSSFQGALKQGRDESDTVVVQSLYKRALGYEHQAVKILSTKDGIVQVPYIERYPPDTTACIFWLKNRQPDKWREKPEGDDSKGLTVKVTGGLPDE